MAEIDLGPSRAEQLLKKVERFKACLRAFLRSPHQGYSRKLLKIGLARIISHFSEHWGLSPALERQRIALLLTCEALWKEVDAGAIPRPPPVIATVEELRVALEVYETLLRRYARPCSIS